MTARSSFDADGVQFAWDSTSIGLFETCPRKYQLKILDRWEPFRKSVHLLFGGWYASALEHYHQHRAADIPYDEAVNLVVAELMIATWDVENIPGPWVTDHPAKTRANLVRTVIWYLEQFKDDGCKTLITSEGAAAVEYSFSLPVDEGIILCGHLDRLVEFCGHVYVQDQKTSGSTVTPRFFDSFSPNTQMSLYSFAGSMIFKVPVKGVMIDAAQIAVGFSRFERGFAPRDVGVLNEWYDGTIDTISRARQATIDNYFPMNPSSCGNYGGCEFRNICSKTPAIRKNFLLGDFTQGPGWDPIERR